jgi:2'-5' RNA ligase superfamily
MAREDSDSEIQFESVAGESALLMRLPDLDRHLAPWIGKWPDDGITTHVTVLVPFLPEAEISGDVLADLRGIFAGFAAHDLTFARTARFPTVLYLVPEPDQPIREMIAAVYARWPQCPPYGGAFDDPTPHATVVHDGTEVEFEEAERVLETTLPLRTRAAAVDLLIYDGSRWNLRERFPLAAD